MTTVRFPLRCACAAALALPAVADDRPNLILFLVDDMGWQESAVPFYGQEPSLLNRRYRTPHMERLARLGVRFTQAYACPVSSPSRCSLLSGMNAARHRVTNWTLEYATPTDAASPTLSLPAWHCNGIQPAGSATAHDLHLSTPVTPLPQLLHDAGYYTIHCGKAHFGARTTAGADPLRLGFDVNIAGGANGGPGSYLAEEEYGRGAFHVGGLEKHYARGTFLTEALTQEALHAMEEPIRRGQPFFLYLSHYAIHVPYEADPRFTAHYLGPDGRGVYDAHLRAPLSRQEVNHAALIEGMDKSLGDVLDFLAARPEVARRTIVLFLSDNGGQAISVRQGNPGRDPNWPARGGKGSALEGGVHVPMMVYWPGVTRGGTVCAGRVMVEDFFPTLLDMAGLWPRPTAQRVDGRSFVPLLRGARRWRRTLVWHYPHVWTDGLSEADGYGPFSALMHGPYHLIYYWESGRLSLYDVSRDISEVNDLAARRPRLLRRLARALTDSLRACGAQRPTWRATGQPVAWPDEAARRY